MTVGPKASPEDAAAKPRRKFKLPTAFTVLVAKARAGRPAAIS